MKGSKNTDVPPQTCWEPLTRAGVRCMPNGELTRGGVGGCVSEAAFLRFYNSKEGNEEDDCHFRQDLEEMSNLESLMLIYDLGQVA